MNEEYNLCEKIVPNENEDRWLDLDKKYFEVKDVKDFIKLLKTNFGERQYYLGIKIIEKINKIAGEKLIWLNNVQT